MKLQRFAVATAVLTFFLLIVGALVHNTGSSLACPDWPLCYGHVFPRMVGGVLVEHSHRLLAASVGVLTIVLMIGLLRRARETGESDLGVLGASALALVVVQGGLGGLTVIFRLPTWTSTSHLAVSMIFFSTLLYIAFRLRAPANREALPPGARRVTLAATLLVYVQMVLGALVRHLGAGLACVDWPLCKGQLFPAGAHPVVQLHMLHRLIAVIAFLLVLTSSIIVFRAARKNIAMRVIAIGLPILVVLQIALGILSITSFRDIVPLTAHLAVAALILASQFSLHLMARGELAGSGARALATQAGAVA